MKKYSIRPIYFSVLLFLIAFVFLIEALGAKSLNYVFDFVGYGGTFANHKLKLFGMPAYWTLMISGYIWCLCISISQNARYGLKKREAPIAATAFLAVSFLGGKILYMLEHPTGLGNLQVGGLSLFGAIFLVPPVFWLICRIAKWNSRALLDLCAHLGLVLLAIVRIGCFISGCCGGPILWCGSNPVILPIQLFEAGLDLLLLEICLQLQNRQPRPGSMYPVLMIGYGSLRFGLEFLRKSQKIFGAFSQSHFFALICVTGGAIALLYIIRTKNANLRKENIRQPTRKKKTS